MRRYLRLYVNFLRFSFSRALHFRVDFLFRIFMDIIYYAVQLGFFVVIYRHTSLLAGWSLDQARIFICAYFVVDAIHMTVISNNMWWLPILINNGDLDYYLVRPVSSLFFVSFRDFAANSFMNLVLATGLLGWALSLYAGELSIGRLLAFIALLLTGCTIFYALRVISIVPIFWLQSTHGTHDLFYGLVNFAERPDRIFTGWLRRALVTVLPFCLIASFPTRILFEGLRPTIVLHVTVIALLSLLVMVAFWRLGLRAYSSASS